MPSKCKDIASIDIHSLLLKDIECIFTLFIQVYSSNLLYSMMSANVQTMKKDFTITSRQSVTLLRQAFLEKISLLADELTHKAPRSWFSLGCWKEKTGPFCQVTKSEKHAWNTIRIVWFSNTSNSRCKVTRNFLEILHSDRLESYATIGMISILQGRGQQNLSTCWWAHMEDM